MPPESRMAGLQGKLRRAIDLEGEYRPFMILAAISGALLALGLLAFPVNIVMMVGLRGALGIFLPSRLRPDDFLPPSAQAPSPA